MKKSAWDKGVALYATELKEQIEERCYCEKRQPANFDELKQWALNGAQSFKEYSYGGCSLIYDSDIAERLCTPSELKRKKGGRLQPNRHETWLDVQARALRHAFNNIKRDFLK